MKPAEWRDLLVRQLRMVKKSWSFRRRLDGHNTEVKYHEDLLNPQKNRSLHSARCASVGMTMFLQASAPLPSLDAKHRPDSRRHRHFLLGHPLPKAQPRRRLRPEPGRGCSATPAVL